jgi:hypothetical protein
MSFFILSAEFFCFRLFCYASLVGRLLVMACKFTHFPVNSQTFAKKYFHSAALTPFPAIKDLLKRQKFTKFGVKTIAYR